MLTERTSIRCLVEPPFTLQTTSMISTRTFFRNSNKLRAVEVLRVLLKDKCSAIRTSTITLSVEKLTLIERQATLF